MQTCPGIVNHQKNKIMKHLKKTSGIDELQRKALLNLFDVAELSVRVYNINFKVSIPFQKTNPILLKRELAYWNNLANTPLKVLELTYQQAGNFICKN